MALNEMQQQAVECTEGPLLILAGAGSGKTTVLVNRVQHIIESELARPWEILAITFTNKAAGEIRERLVNAIGEEAASKLNDQIYAFGLVTVGENSVIPSDVKIGKNTAISGITDKEDYPDGALAGGEYIIKAGEGK